MTRRTSRPSVAARQTASWLARNSLKPKVWWSRVLRFIRLLSFAYCSREGIRAGGGDLDTAGRRLKKDKTAKSLAACFDDGVSEDGYVSDCGCGGGGFDWRVVCAAASAEESQGGAKYGECGGAEEAAGGEAGEAVRRAAAAGFSGAPGDYSWSYADSAEGDSG